jgi:hypothetical protein
MRETWRAIGLLLTLGAVVAGVAYKAGQWAEQGADYRQKRDTLVLTITHYDTVYKTDTLRLRRLVTRWDTVRQTVEVWKHDTLRVVEYVQAADSTIRQCQVTLATCDQLRLLQANRADLAEAEVRRLLLTQPSTRRRVIELVGATTAGLVLGRVIR